MQKIQRSNQFDLVIYEINGATLGHHGELFGREIKPYILSCIRRSIKNAAISNLPENELKLLLKNLGMLGLFEQFFVETSDKKISIARAMARFNSTPDRTQYIGHDFDGLTAAREMKLKTAALNSLYEQESVFQVPATSNVAGA